MSDFDEQEKRILAILGESNLGVSNDSVRIYRDYLIGRVAKPCELTGGEDFHWEEYYILGPGDPIEYEELKKTRPSYKDTFTFIKFDDFIDDDAGIMVKVRRVADKKQFVLPLVDLKATDKKTEVAQIIHDYFVWFINY